MHCNRFQKKITLLCLLVAGILTGCGVKAESSSSDTPDMPTSVSTEEDLALIDEDMFSVDMDTASFELPEKQLPYLPLQKNILFCIFPIHI